MDPVPSFSWPAKKRFTKGQMELWKGSELTRITKRTIEGTIRVGAVRKPGYIQPKNRENHKVPIFFREKTDFPF